MIGLAVAVSVVTTSGVKADGMMIPRPRQQVTESDQRAVIWHDGKRETMVLSTTFRGNAEDFAWIIPVPNKPEVQKGKDELFTALDELTKPQYRDSIPSPIGNVGFDSASPTGGGAKVNVLQTTKVDIFDVTILEANEGKALREWLENNGYEYPAGKQHLLQYYVDKNWYFTAVKVNTQALGYAGSALRSGHPTPLVLAFDSEQIVYPLKISGPAARWVEGEKTAAFGFETGVQGWNQFSTPPYGDSLKRTPGQVGISNEQVWQGAYALKISATTGSGYEYGTAINNLQVGKQYVYSAYIMAENAAGTANLKVKGGSLDISGKKLTLAGLSKWTRVEMPFVATSTSHTVALSLATDERAAVYVDGVQVEIGTTASEFEKELLPGSVSTNIDSNANLMLYVFSNHKKTAPGFSIEYAGNVSGKTIESLAVDDSGEPWVKGKKMYLTKLTRSMRQSEMLDDVIIRDAGDNTAVGSGGNTWEWKNMLILVLPVIAELAIIGYIGNRLARKKEQHG